jgi:metal-sulfur cluster biosynthetic enzyme
MHVTRERVIEVLEEVRDPCLGAAGLELSILDLGLIDNVEVDGGRVAMDITFTEPGCMFTHRIIAEIQDRVGELGAEAVDVTPKWLPVWSDDKLSVRGAAAFAACAGTMARS